MVQPNRGAFTAWDTGKGAGDQRKNGLGVVVTYSTAGYFLGLQSLDYLDEDRLKVIEDSTDDEILDKLNPQFIDRTQENSQQPPQAFEASVPRVMKGFGGKPIVVMGRIKGVRRYSMVLSSTSKIRVPRQSREQGESNNGQIPTELKHVGAVSVSFPTRLITPSGQVLRPRYRDETVNERTGEVDKNGPVIGGKGITDFLFLQYLKHPDYLGAEQREIIVGFVNPQETFYRIRVEEFDDVAPQKFMPQNGLYNNTVPFYRKEVSASTLQPNSRDEENLVLGVNRQVFLPPKLGQYKPLPKKIIFNT